MIFAWERSLFLPNTSTCEVNGITVAIYSNPHITPRRWKVFSPGFPMRLYSTRSSAEYGAELLVRLATAHKCLNERNKQMQIVFTDLYFTNDPKPPNQVPPPLEDEVGDHDESDFNEDDPDDEEADEE